jgi:iron uptake system component EfeO
VFSPARRSIALTALLFVGAIAACSGGATQAPSGSIGPSGSAGSAAPSSAGPINVGAREYAFDPSTLSIPAGEVTFHVTNTGTIEHEFEILNGETVVDEIEGLIPALEKDLKVTLAPGSYTYVCRLAGHEEAGMKGTLTVTGG